MVAMCNCNRNEWIRFDIRSIFLFILEYLAFAGGRFPIGF